MGDMDTDQKELETLRRMLATPPTPHKAKAPSPKRAEKKKMTQPNSGGNQSG